MIDAPKEIWARGCQYEPDWTSDPDLTTFDHTSYTRTDIAKAEYKRGLEESAKIADETATCILPSGHFLSERVASAIRAQIQERGD